MLRTLNETGTPITHFAVAAPALGELIRSVRDGELDTTRGRQVFQHMVETGSDVESARQVARASKQSAPTRSSPCARNCWPTIRKIVADVKNGKHQALGP